MSDEDDTDCALKMRKGVNPNIFLGQKNCARQPDFQNPSKARQYCDIDTMWMWSPSSIKTWGSEKPWGHILN